MKKDQIDSNNIQEEVDNDSASEPENSILSYEKLSRREIRSVIFHLLYAMETFDYEVSMDEIVDSFNRCFISTCVKGI